MIKSWETLEKKQHSDLRIFQSEFAKRKHPKTGAVGYFTILNSPDWVNIIPITASGKIVMIEQYRHGSDNITLEVPGGMIEEGEDHRIAGQRECTEETGYFSEEDAVLLGTSEPNPAFMNNKMYHYLWKNCELKFEQNFDEFEDIRVVLYSQEEIKQLIKDGKIKHSLVLSAFYFQQLKNL